MAAPVPPPPATQLFADHLPLARAYAELLVTDGVVRGLIGPREAPRIWDRHLLNSAAVAELIPSDSLVVDVGSGAGLPGLAIAVARPDLTVVLVEALARRTAFLGEAVATLGLGDRVSVLRARAEESAAALPGPADVVTARAVAPLDRLARWCLPLVAVGGRVLALKGAAAAEEIAAHEGEVVRVGGGTPVVRRCGAGLLDPPATVVEIVKERDAQRPASAAGRRSSARRGRDRRR